ncbi:MAG: amidohydrolase family protein [Phycisphaerales bacterium]
MDEPHHTSQRAEGLVGSKAAGDARYAQHDAANRVFAVRCAGFADARGTLPASDSLLAQTTGPRERRILAIGTADEVRTHPAWPHAERLDLPGRVVAPALANAHTHLDLTHLGPRPLEGDFARWIDMVRTGRATEDTAIAASVRQGVEMLALGGTVAVGDIAGSVGGAPSLAPARVLDGAGLLGVSFLEFFGLSDDGSPGLDRALEQARAFEPSTMRLGLEPHAPYSASLGAYARAKRSGLPICTHLAESQAERQLVAEGAGPIRDMLGGLGLWTQAVAGQFGHGSSPVAHLADLLDGVLAVHLNDVANADLQVLAGSGVRVVYCPRASAYFGAPEAFGPHRYREMLDAGVSVVLGTDSIINLPADDVALRGICVLDEARLLVARDGVAPDVVLEMLYGHGPMALGLEPQRFMLAAGGLVAGLIGVDVAAVAEGDPAGRMLEARGVLSFL